MSDLFTKYLFEADEPEETSIDPPEVEMDEDPIDDTLDDNPPPDIETDDTDISIDDNIDYSDTNFEDQDSTDKQEDLFVDEKIELIMKKDLYNKYLKLINAINDIEGNFINNNDAIFSKSPEASKLISNISKLKRNTMEYATFYFMDKPYAASMILFEKLMVYFEIIISKFQDLMKKANKE